MKDGDAVDEAVMKACRDIQAVLRRMDMTLHGKGLDVEVTVKRMDSGEWGVFASTGAQETIQ